MIDALDLEIAAIRKKGGGIKIELRGGERFGQAEGSWLYRFLVVEDLNLRDDTPVRVTAGQEDVPGILVSFRDGVLLVALEKDLGPRIAVARLVANDSFLVERLKECLGKVRSGEIQFGRAAADRVLGLVPPTTADSDPHPSVLGDGTANDDQIRAVRRSLQDRAGRARLRVPLRAPRRWGRHAPADGVLRGRDRARLPGRAEAHRT